MYIVFDPMTGTYKPDNNSLEELEATIIPFSPCPDPRRIMDIPAAHPTRLKIFITEWDRFMYLRMPQGYLASGDAYTHRYDEIIKNISHKIKNCRRHLTVRQKYGGCLLLHS